MKYLIVLLLTAGGLNAQTVLERTVNCRIDAPDVPAALRQLADCADVEISFSAGFFPTAEARKLDLRARTLESGLRRVLDREDIAYQVSDGRILLYRRAAARHTFSGYVERADSGERLVSATVYCPGLERGTLTNEYGFFSIELPAGRHRLSFSYLGYQEATIELDFQNDRHKRIPLHSANFLTEVIVTPDSLENPYFFSREEDFHELSPELLRTVPSLAGESDPVRAAQLLPGVQAGGDGLGGIQVRGGDNGHNRMLIDGVPVYIPYHLMGMFSVYNAATVRSAQILTGGFSARYGGALAAIFDVRIREGNRYRWSSEAGVNLSTAQLLIEGPLAREKASLLVAGRTNYTTRLFAPTLRRTLSVSEESDLESGYRDYNVKFNYELSKRDRLYLSYYQGGDAITLLDSLDDEEFVGRNEVELNWGNTITALRWNHLFNDRLFANLSLTYSLNRFEYTNLLQANLLFEEDEEEEDELFFYNVASTNRDRGLRLDVDYLPDARHTLRCGGGAVARTFAPAVSIFDEDSEELDDDDFDEIDDFVELIEERTTRATDLYVYGEDRWQIRNELRLDLGLRASTFLTTDIGHARLEPRVAVHYAFAPQWNWTTSTGRMVQYLHLIAGTSLQFPTDLWLPASEEVAPQSSWLLETRLRRRLHERTHLSLGVYYRRLRNLYRLAPFNSTLTLTGETLGENLLAGTGRSSGVEIFVDHHRERGGLIASYVLSDTRRAYDDLNDEQPFPFDYDARHQIKLFAYLRIGEHWRVSTNWFYHSPQPRRYVEFAFFGGSQSVEIGGAERNRLRSEPYHRVDLEITYTRATGRFTHLLTLGGYNVYDRRNIAFYELPFDGGMGTPTPVHTLPFLPSLRYQVNF